MLSILALTVALHAPSVPTCGALRLEAGTCAQTPYGVIIGDDRAMADRMAEVMRQGEARFRTHFGREPTPYAVLVGDTVNPVAESGVAGFGNVDLQGALNEAGAQHVLPWFTAEQRARLAAAATRRAIEAEARGEGLEGDALDAAVEQRLAAAAPVPPANPDQDSAAAHELGHMWMVAAFWPDRAGGGAVGHYGGPAADWFDESSAVLMEDDALAAGRRAFFRKQWTLANGVRPKPLASYFVDPHPLASAGARIRVPASGQIIQAPPRSEGGRVQVPASGQTIQAPPVSEATRVQIRTPDGRPLRLEDLPPGAVIRSVEGAGPAPLGTAASGPARPPRFLSVASSAAFSSDADRDAALMFYAQARVFADFLFELTGEQAVYSQIAAALARGETMDQWLAAEGPALNLGGSVAELENQWEAWLTRTYGAPA